MAAIFLVGSFVSFGGYFFSRSPYDAALRVNGEKISYKQYQETYRQYERSQSRNKSGQPADPPFIAKRKVTDSLVQETLLSQEADKYGIVVTDNELASYIQSIPAFQRDKRFDQRTYAYIVVNMLGMSIPAFEEEQRRELKIQKWKYLVAST